MREIPGTFTGVSPWQLAFGYASRDPCAILKNTWMGGIAFPPNLNNEFAASHLQREQNKWVKHYNLRSRHKEFFPGEFVIILSPDFTTSRLWSRWRAPAKIVREQGDYSYLVEINGATPLIHAKKLRKCDVKVSELVCESFWPQPAECAEINTCAVVYENDKDFGQLKYVETKTATNDLPSSKIDLSKLAHLSQDQRQKLLAVLDKYPKCFLETLCRCNTAKHEIIVTPDFRPKKKKNLIGCLQKLCPEVDKQIKKLEELGFIKKSKSLMVSLLIFVIKKINQ